MIRTVMLLLLLLPQDSQTRGLCIELSADGMLRIAGRTVEWKGVDAELRRLAALNYVEVLLDVDPSVPFSSVTRIMDACRRVGLKTIKFTSVKSDLSPNLARGTPGIRIKIRDGVKGPQIIVMQEIPVTTMEELQTLLEKTEKLPIVIDAEYETSYGLVNDVARVCMRTGFRSLSFATSIPRASGSAVRQVLYVEHRPRWEYRFLKNALIRDPKIRAHFLLTSGDETFPQDHSPGLKPLREFPVTLKTLQAYDALILGDVPPTSIGGNAAMDRIEQYVKAGGGLILIAGSDNNLGHYLKTSLEPLLPVMPMKEFEHELIDRNLEYRLTSEGEKHPITQMGPSVEATRKIWKQEEKEGKRLPAIRYSLRTESTRREAKVLVEVVDKGTTVPLWVVMQYGRGRVFLSTTDETYRWRWLCGDAPYFYPFWQRVIDWATRSE
jgi:biopolymer transport protein ExbD/uncharacterized membrane protein